MVSETTVKCRLDKTTSANTGFASGGVTCKLGALGFYSSSVQVDSYVLRNPPERKARNRYVLFPLIKQLNEMKNTKVDLLKDKNLTEEQKEKINRALNELGSMRTMYNYVGINPQVESKEWLMKHYSFDEKKAESFYEIANILNGMKEEKLFTYEDIGTISKNEGFNALALYVWKQEIVCDK